MLLLIVKGSRETAFAAAEAHSVSFWFEAENQFNETYLCVTGNQRAKVHDWFGEVTQAPYPDGTLLFFTERTDR